MRRLGHFIHVGETREVETKNGKMNFTDVTFSWSENEANAEPYEQSLTMSVTGDLDREKIEESIKRKDTVQFVFFLESRQYKERYITSCRGYLPKEYKK